MIDLQSSTVNFLFYIAIFVGVMLAFEGLQQLFQRGETRNEARNRRMQLIQRGATTDAVLELLRDPAMLQSASKGGPMIRLHRLLVQAGLTLKPSQALAGMALLGGLVYVVASARLAPQIAVLVASGAAVALPLLVLSGMKQARLKKLTMQLPDALDLMARGLKVGHPVSVTVASVARDMPDPIGSELGLIQDQISYGDDVATAFRDFGERVGTEDANYLAVSIGIQHGTGGNLARILNVLSQVIRDRHTMRKKIKAISAEGRLSGAILSVLPLIIYGVIELSTPSFYGDVRNDPMFPFFLYAIIGLMATQALILFRLVKFKF